ncbi:LCM-domain-containing protein [Mollisia scopiformis]|uniref:tRNA wybutosine-synthesizing protein 4 n=1 Tax=Mollisia scopiformis TaxID=149040 RepID=A0A194XST8_MOLSC|nr:LCM-domain-containing protein [Mollisia scopiformis]KUJ23104.1 LCM-domain-containing protein [Mollisia scopiformis]
MKKPNNTTPPASGAKPTNPSTKSKSQVQDDSIMGTNNSSIVSKRSVERLYYPNEQFFRHFVKKFQRRSPLINRGYWLRMKAIDQVVRQFLELDTEKPKVVINLGCGYDPLPWQCLTRYKSHCQRTKFVDIDYRDLMLKKRNVVENAEDLKSLLTNVKVSEGDVLLQSDQYLQIGCDLRDLESLNRVLPSVIDLERSLVLFTAEVSITYMNVEAADALIFWASKLPQARFCLLEQLLPDGKDHPFSQTMMAHFNKLGTPLRAVEKYPTTSAQKSRFHSLGWPNVAVCNLWRLWSLPDFVSSTDREHLNGVEPFDEWEEFSLFGCHYFLLVADTEQSFARPLLAETEIGRKVPSPEPKLKLNVTFEEHPKHHGCRRFAAAMPLASHQRTVDDVGIFGGMGLMTRLNSYDVYSSRSAEHVQQKSLGRSFARPVSRMCHTLTDLGDTGAILVGGRTSPDAGLTDCWLYHKWLDTWERVDDLPQPMYRHQAVNLGDGRVLVSTGRIDSRTITTDYLIWSRRAGWIKCAYGEGDLPLPAYGVTFGICSPLEDFHSSTSMFGILAGGMTSDSRMPQTSWRWDLKLPDGLADQQPIISFQRLEGFESHADVARFGASVVSHQGHTYVLGGIIKDEILSSFKEVCTFRLHDCAGSFSEVLLSSLSGSPRPLMVGITAVSIEETLLLIGGSAVCFSFGTFWNQGCFNLRSQSEIDKSYPVAMPWKYVRTMEANALGENLRVPTSEAAHSQSSLKSLPRIRVSSPGDFEKLVYSSLPMILEGLDIGSCTTKWTAEYLKDKIGVDREIIVHQATTEHMNFTTKNFEYVPRKFGEFIDQIESGEKLYLRSLSSEKPSEKAADISQDFPTIAEDFGLPPELQMVLANAHSSPLRISGPVNMWLHYDVMANVLCQIRGSKRLLLFPPTDFKHFRFEPGASSSPVNVFDKLKDGHIPGVHPHEALLQPGDVLFLPPLWLHTASPTSGWSISANVFFRNLSSGYAAGKDVYGNRDLQAYEKGRQDIAKIATSFGKLPTDIRDFYLQRLVDEFKQKAGGC